MKPLYLTLGLLALMTYFPLSKTQERQENVKTRPQAHQTSSTSISSNAEINLNSSGQQKLRPSKSFVQKSHDESYDHSTMTLHRLGQRQSQQNIPLQQRKEMAKSFSNQIYSKSHGAVKFPITPTQKEVKGRFQATFGPLRFHSNVAIQGKGAQSITDQNVPQNSGHPPSKQKIYNFSKSQQLDQSKLQLDASSQSNLSQQKRQPKTLIKGNIDQDGLHIQTPVYGRLSQKHNSSKIILQQKINQQKSQKKTLQQTSGQGKWTPQKSFQRKPGQQKFHSQKSTLKKFSQHKIQSQKPSKANRPKHQTNTIYQERPNQSKVHPHIFIQKTLGRKSHSQILKQGSPGQHKGYLQIRTKGKIHKPKHHQKQPMKGRTSQPTSQQKEPKAKIPVQHVCHPQKHVPRIHSSIHVPSPQISQQIQPGSYLSVGSRGTSHHYDPNSSVHNHLNSHEPRENPAIAKTKNKSNTDVIKPSTMAIKQLNTNKTIITILPNTFPVSAATSLINTTSANTATGTNASASILPVFITKSAVTKESESSPSSATMTTNSTDVASPSASSAATARVAAHLIATSATTNIHNALDTSASSFLTSGETMFSLITSTPFIPHASISTDTFIIPASEVIHSTSDHSIPAALMNSLAGAIQANNSNMPLSSNESVSSKLGHADRRHTSDILVPSDITSAASDILSADPSVAISTDFTTSTPEVFLISPESINSNYTSHLIDDITTSTGVALGAQLASILDFTNSVVSTTSNSTIPANTMQTNTTFSKIPIKQADTMTSSSSSATIPVGIMPIITKLDPGTPIGINSPASSTKPFVTVSSDTSVICKTFPPSAK
ncbi:uncharacterized protein LOC141516034 [Macrotis lagotis]|uniref:uncharacterized protein LOC141516034 n=1 Tax=Macrotis lagotis TaxID=92651 RepID=UPI003D68E542